jgi:hypothetical protein
VQVDLAPNVQFFPIRGRAVAPKNGIVMKREFMSVLATLAAPNVKNGSHVSRPKT